MNAVCSKPRGELRFNEPMARHTSWKIGGNAERLYIPADIDDLQCFLIQQNEQEKITFVGLGSNILVSDQGIKGTVILMKGGPQHIYIRQGRLYADAGISCARLSRYASAHAMPALAFLAGIPGTLGGALAMNAGAFGSEIWQFVDKVKMIDSKGSIHSYQKQDFDIAYRFVDLQNRGWFVQAVFPQDLCADGKGEDTIRTLLDKRRQSQPIGLPSCGSVFKNPPGHYAAQLIEQAGLKGKRIGDAQVSEKHANFIINLGDARAEDVRNLMSLIQQKVAEDFAVKLQPEVRFVGEW